MTFEETARLLLETALIGGGFKLYFARQQKRNLATEERKTSAEANSENVKADENVWTLYKKIQTGYAEIEAALNLLKKDLTVCTQAVSDAEVIARERQRVLRRIAAKLQLAYFETDAQGSCEYVSQGWLDLVGLQDQAEALGTNWTQLLLDNERGETVRRWNRHCLNESADPFFWRFRHAQSHTVSNAVAYLFLTFRRDGSLKKIYGLTEIADGQERNL